MEPKEENEKEPYVKSEYELRLDEEKEKIRKHYKSINKYISQEKITFLAIKNTPQERNDDRWKK